LREPYLGIKGERRGCQIYWTLGRSTKLPDFTLLFAAAALTLLGLVMVASASAPLSYEHYQRPDYLFLKQLIAALVGFCLLLWLIRLDYRRLFEIDGLLLLAALGLILLTFLPPLAPEGLWLRLGPISLQPTEFMKLALIVFLAASLVRKGGAGELESFSRGVLPYFALFGVLAILALAQPDFALVVIYGAIVGFMLLAAGAKLLHIVGPFSAGFALFLGAIWVSPYHRERLLSFLNPFADPSGSGYQSIQSLIALGSGGLFGQGLGAGREKWFYLPSAYNDFILAIIGEELGLIGAALVLGLFSLLAWRGFRIAFYAPDRFGFLLASGLTFALAFQAAVNFGVAVGALPVTGLTLPMVSYGGSSLVVSLAMIGILLSISRHLIMQREGGGLERPRSRRGYWGTPLPRFGHNRRSAKPLWRARPHRLCRHVSWLGGSGALPLCRGGVL
jgi:cell division protein FtsW